MQGESILQTIAEVSVAFAGFTGVAVALGRTRLADQSIPDVHAFRAMLTSSLQALLFSILPFLLDASGIREPVLWRAGSVLLALGLTAGACADAYYMRLAGSVERPALDRVLRIAIPAVGVPTIVAQILNAIGFVERAFAPYLAGLLFLLFFSSLMFVRLLTVVTPTARPS